MAFSFGSAGFGILRAELEEHRKLLFRIDLPRTQHLVVHVADYEFGRRQRGIAAQSLTVLVEHRSPAFAPKRFAHQQAGRQRTGKTVVLQPERFQSIHPAEYVGQRARHLRIVQVQRMQSRQMPDRPGKVSADAGRREIERFELLQIPDRSGYEPRERITAQFERPEPAQSVHGIGNRPRKGVRREVHDLKQRRTLRHRRDGSHEPRLRSPYLRQLRQIAEGFGQTPRKVVPGKVQHAELRKSSHRPGQIATHAVAAQIELPEPLQLPEHIGQRAGDPVIFQIETK